MLKGVNKHVVEVCDIDHRYFDKAILFLRAEEPDRDEQTLRAEAREYLRAIRYLPRRPFSAGRLALAAAKLAAAAGAGAAVALLLK